MTSNGPRVVALRCPGAFFGEAINATGFLRVSCRARRCEGPDGAHPDHVFDLATGWMTNDLATAPGATADRDEARITRVG